MAYNVHKLAQTIICFNFCNSGKQFPDPQQPHVMIFNNLYTCRKTMKIYRGTVDMHSIAYKISQKSVQVKIESEY